MIEIRDETVIILLCMLIIASLVGNIIFMNVLENKERKDLYLKSHSSFFKYVNGIYAQNNYYCVWVKDKTIKEINRTETHEQCHHYVFTKFNHFCEGNTIP